MAHRARRGSKGAGVRQGSVNSASACSSNPGSAPKRRPFPSGSHEENTRVLDEKDIHINIV